jgi:hypothetical protein
MAAAAVLAVAVLGGMGGIKLMGSRPEALSATRGQSRPAGRRATVRGRRGGDDALLPGLAGGRPGVQVAFVVDPGLGSR